MAATRGGDLWWDYRWRYFFITVSPGRLALFSSSSQLRLSSSFFRRRFSPWYGWLAPAGLTARSFFGTAYISRNVHAPARERVQLAGGCILITFMSSDIPARFIAPAPADSAKAWNQRVPVPPLACLLSYAPWSSRSASSVFLVLAITLHTAARVISPACQFIRRSTQFDGSEASNLTERRIAILMEMREKKTQSLVLNL